MLPKLEHRIVIAGLCFVTAAISSLMAGNTPVSPDTAIQALFNFDSEDSLHDVATGARVSRAVITLLTGAALAVSGLSMQALTRNPIASPGLFGVNANVVFFAVFSITFTQIQSLKMIVATVFLGAIVVTVLVIALGMFRQALFSPHRVILAGTAIAILLTAFTQSILIMNGIDLQGLSFWLSGSVSLHDVWDTPWVILLALMLISIIFSIATHINILMTSGDAVTGLGRNIKLVK